jgi:hypothetical protein
MVIDFFAVAPLATEPKSSAVGVTVSLASMVLAEFLNNSGKLPGLSENKDIADCVPCQQLSAVTVIGIDCIELSP